MIYLRKLNDKIVLVGWQIWYTLRFFAGCGTNKETNIINEQDLSQDSLPENAAVPHMKI